MKNQSLTHANNIADAIYEKAAMKVRDADTKDLILIVRYWDIRDAIQKYLLEKE